MRREATEGERILAALNRRFYRQCRERGIPTRWTENDPPGMVLTSLEATPEDVDDAA